MFEHMTEEQARAQILEQVAGYCDTFHKKRHTEKATGFPMRPAFMTMMRW